MSSAFVGVEIIFIFFFCHFIGTSVEVAEEQDGFMPDRGTHNDVFMSRMLTERVIEMQNDVYLCFIDYCKAFHRVRHEPLFEMLESLDAESKDEGSVLGSTI